VVALSRFTNLLQILVMAEFWKSVSASGGVRCKRTVTVFCVLVFLRRTELCCQSADELLYVNGRSRPFTFNRNKTCVPAVIVALRRLDQGRSRKFLSSGTGGLDAGSLDNLLQGSTFFDPCLVSCRDWIG